MKTGGMWFTFPQLAGGANVTFLNPSLDLSIVVERASPSPWQNDCKTKDWMAQREWQNGSYCYNNTDRRGYLFRSGGKTNVSDALKTKEGDSVHSTFSTNKKWKRVGGLCQQESLGVNGDHLISLISVASSLSYAEMLLSDDSVILDWTGAIRKSLNIHFKPGHAQVTQPQKFSDVYFMPLECKSNAYVNLNHVQVKQMVGIILSK